METICELEIFSFGRGVSDFGIDGDASGFQGQCVEQLELEVPDGAGGLTIAKGQGHLERRTQSQYFFIFLFHLE